MKLPLRIKLCLCGSLVSLLLLSLPSRADEINVAVASNFTAPMRQIAALFESRTGHKLNLSFGASGRFHAQISNGAPFDLFLSADQDKPQALEAAGYAVAGTRFTYALGRLVLWSANPELVDAQGEILARGTFNKLALANPALAPYGAAAVEVLEHLGLVEATRPKWVQGENIAQVFQFVFTANAELGFVALSQLKDVQMAGGSSDSAGGAAGGSAWIVPVDLHAPIRQDAVLLKTAQGNAAAQELWEFLRSAEVLQIIESYGYDAVAQGL